MLALFKNKAYLKFWLAQTIASLGDGISRVIITYLVAMHSQNPLLVGLVIFAQLLPGAVFGIFMGPLADRMSRRWLMVGSDFYRMIVVVGMIFFQGSAMALIGLVFLQGIGAALFDPARASSIPALVGEKQIPQAIGLSQGTSSAMQIIGPALGGLLLLLASPTLNFSVNALTYLISALLLLPLTMLGKPEATGATESYLSSIRSGIKGVMSFPALRFLLVLLIPVIFAVGILNTNLSAIMLFTFEVPATDFAFLSTFLGIGAMVGSLIGPTLLQKFRPSLLLLTSTGLIGLWMAGVIPLDMLRTEYGLSVVYVWYLVTGVLNALINVPLSSLFLGLTPQEFRGRGAALFTMTVSSFQLIGILVGGWLAGELGALLATLIAGMMLVGSVLVLPLLKGYKALHNVGEKKKDTVKLEDQLATD
ncbi:MFS transporter [Bacillus horti]|uniref:MFS family permease n=1 Tax=Caldalkalibacillus horti TaxID=77523 RepID=A0ABT9W5J8_9BACI|nr:MFS transporter [Bacillus horti]MDQ0168506.1 MFS family permease [Bacillus horti]